MVIRRCKFLLAAAVLVLSIYTVGGPVLTEEPAWAAESYALVDRFDPSKVASGMEPVDVATSRRRDIYLLDKTSSKVYQLTSGWKPIGSFGGAGTGPGEFTGPTGISISRNGYVFVADTGNHRIQVLSPRGKYIRSIGGESEGDPDWLSAPGDVAFGPQRTMYVADPAGIKIFRQSGKYLGKWSVGASNIASDKYGNVYLPSFSVERYGAGVAKYDRHGQKIDEWYSELDMGPYGIAADRQGNVFLSRSWKWLHSVVKSTTNGEPLCYLERPSEVMYEFYPIGRIEAASNGDVLVIQKKSDEAVLRYRPDSAAGP